MTTPSDLANFTHVASLGTSPYVYKWATADGDETFPTPVRFIRATDAGNIAVRMINPANRTETTVVLAFAAGETQAIAVSGIVAATTTCTALQAYV